MYSAGRTVSRKLLPGPEFWKREFRRHPVYHVILSPVNTLAAVVIDIPSGNGIAYPSAVFGGCPRGAIGIVDIAVYEPDLFTILSKLAPGVNPTTFPFFLEHNVVECESEGPGINCGDILNPNALCCILGFHDSNGPQTFGTGDFDTSEIFVSPTPDVNSISHEVGEWMNDPFGNNPTPARGHTGQVPGFQNNLEVGDPLSGTLAPPIFQSGKQVQLPHARAGVFLLVLWSAIRWSKWMVLQQRHVPA
jgi:hypothetical protein